MRLIDRRSKRHPGARTPDELEAPASGNKIYRDDDVRGFGLRVTAAGARAFILNYRAKGRERRLTIGAYPDFTVAAAREEAKRLKREIGGGHDPLAAAKAAREAPTMADLAARYVDEHLPEKRPSSRKDDLSALELDILPGLGRLKKVADITGTDIKKLHRRISERAPYRANRVIALLSKMFNLAIEQWSMRDRVAGNPCEGIKRNQEVKRKRYLKPDELARLVAALDTFPNKQAADIVRMLLLTGARSGEASAMRWDQLDLDAGKWTKPGATTKQKTEHEVPLSPDAVQLLVELREQAGADDEFVFPGRDGAGHRADHLKKPWPAICKAAGITGLRMHDLRHSYASFLASAGHGLPVIGAMLGHTQPATTARYAHLLDEPLRKAAGQVGAIVKSAKTSSKKHLRVVD